MKRKLALAPALIILTAGIIFTGPAARADSVNFSLSSTTFSGSAGQTVNFLGTISAPGTNRSFIDLQGLNITFGDNLGGPWLAFNNINPAAFYSLPEFLNPGTSLSNVLLFTAMIDPRASAASGLVRVDLTAFDAAGNNVSATTMAAAQVVPEPSSLLMLSVGLIGLSGIARRKRLFTSREQITKDLNHSKKAFISLPLVLPLIVSTAVGAYAQEDTSNSATTPLVYNVENTGASFAPPAFASFEKLPIIRPLPDPFVFADGHRDTSFGNWEQRRNEIKASIEKYEIGPKPDCHDCTITATWVPATAPTRGTLTINVARNGNTITIPTRCYIPAGVTSPIPAIIPMVLSAGSSGLGRGSLPADAFAGMTIGSCDFPHNSVTTYGGPTRNDNFYKLYPEYCAGATACTNAGFGPSNHGQYAAWSWGVSRVIDGIAIAARQAANPLPIDVTRLAVTGCSYAGKMALFAGAFDERIALTIAQENGGGGQPSWRASQQIEADDVVENLTHTDTNWFASQMWQFQGNNVYKLPHDHHELAAMIAPRALLETGNTNYLWLTNRSNYISSRATQRIYNTFGIGDRFGFYIDGGHAHCGTLPAESPVITAWFNKFMFGDTMANTDTEVFPINPPLAYDYTRLDYGRWTAWWGTSNPVFPNNWNPGDGSVVLSTTAPNLPIYPGDTVFAGYALSMPGGHPDATVTANSDAYSDLNVQTDVACSDGSSYTVTVPMPKQSYSWAAGDNSWYPSGDPASASSYQGSIANSSAAACSSGVVTNCVFSALGTQTTRGAGNAAGPGFSSTDTADPVNVSFHYSVNAADARGIWSLPQTVFYTTNVWGTVQIAGSVQLTKVADGSYQAVITLNNKGTGTAQYVNLLSATLGGAATGSSLPQSLGPIQPSGAITATVNFPASAGVSGSGSVVTIGGTYAGGSYSTSFRVRLP